MISFVFFSITGLDTLASFPWTSTLMYEVQIRLVRSKLSTWLPAYQPVYFLCTMAFYITEFCFGLYIHGHDLILRSCACGCSFSRWNYRPCVHSWDNSCQSVPSGIILNVLYVMSVWAQATQNSNTVHNFFFPTSDITWHFHATPHP